MWLRFGNNDDPERMEANTKNLRSIQEGLEQLRSFSRTESKRVSKTSDTRSQESLIKENELPVLNGFMPYGWIC